ncbi:MAG: hypothetical protein RR295_03470, partial [Oscillospiraceae bacterium]
MAFLDELGKKAKDAVSYAGEKAQAAATYAGEKAKDAAELAKLTMAIAGEQREMEKNYKTIGEWFTTEFQGEIPEAVRDLVEAVNASKAKIVELEAAKANDEPEIVVPAEPTMKVCPICGAASDSR